MTVDPRPALRLADLAERYWRAYLAHHPISATPYGERAYDDRVDDISPAASERHRGHLEGLLTEARSVESAVATAPGVQPAERVTASALIDQIEMDLALLDADVDPWTVDPIDGVQVAIFNIESFQPVATVEQGRAMVARWNALPRLLDQHRANLREALAGGRVAVHAPVERAAEGLRDLLAQPDDAWALLAPAGQDHADWAPADLERFRANLRSAVRDGIRPAMSRLLDVLVAEILPAARSNTTPGIDTLPGGPEAYGKLVRHHTSLHAHPEAIHRVGLDEVARINGELEALGARVLGTTDRQAILARLRSDPDLYFRTPDQVEQTAASALARATAAVPGWFGILPRAGCEVVRMGDHEARHGTIAYYREPAPDGTRPGRYYINTSEPQTRPRYEAEALGYHESVPGHHLQIAVAQEVPGLPDFRRHLGVTAFWEGWALYAERLADEMGLYSGDLDRIGMLSLDAWRACRLVVDTGIHALGWSRQRAIDYMLANTALAPNNIVNEVDRYIVWPGQALAYKTGQLEILRLRAEVAAALGARFDVRAFHDNLLRGGALSLETAGRIVRASLGAGTGS